MANIILCPSNTSLGTGTQDQMPKKFCVPGAMSVVPPHTISCCVSVLGKPMTTFGKKTPTAIFGFRLILCQCPFAFLAKLKTSHGSDWIGLFPSLSRPITQLSGSPLKDSRFLASRLPPPSQEAITMDVSSSIKDSSQRRESSSSVSGK
jgi:hypothetical protein